MKSRLILCIGLLVGSLLTTNAFCQSQVEEGKKATLLFDLQLQRLQDGELMKALGVGEQLQMMQQAGGGGVDPTKLSRVFGCMSLPDSIAELENQDPNAPLPMDMFIQMNFADEASAKAALDEMLPQMEQDGDLYKPTADAEVPPNMRMKMPNSKTMVMGTTTFINHSPKELFSTGLASAWSKFGDAPIRISLDMKAEASLINQAVEMGKSSTEDAMAKGMLDLVDNAEDVRLSIDPDGSNLLELAATGVDESQAEELRGGLDMLLGFAKLGGKNMLPMAGLEEKSAQTFGELLESLAAKRDGRNVVIAIPRPEGFVDAMKEGIAKGQQMMMQQMMGGGLGQPPGAGEDPFGAGGDDAGGDPFGGGNDGGDEDPFGDG